MNRLEHKIFALEFDAAGMSKLLEQVGEKIIEHIISLPDQPASNVEDGALLAAKIRQPLPETGENFDVLLNALFDETISKSFNSAGPGYMAYIPGGGIFHAALADLISKAVNRYVGVWEAAPGLVQIETTVIRWFCDIVDYPDSAGGFLTSGGSLANFSALFTARREHLAENFLNGTIYTSDQTHHSVQKAAVLAGFPAKRVRIVATDENYRIRIDHLTQLIDLDRQRGLTPFAIVANAGTTNSGAIDDLESIASICQKQALWLHVDAAYGGFFMLTARGQAMLQGLNKADSITLDPHKSLFLPYGTGCLIVRDRASLKRAHAADADYMPAMQEDPDLVDFCQISPELTREFRGLRIWLPVKMHGISVFRNYLDEKLDLVRWMSTELKKVDHIELLSEPQLTVVTFKARADELDAPAVNAVTRNLLENINQRTNVFLTGTMLGDHFAIRICVLCFRTHQAQMETCLRDIIAACEQILDGPFKIK